MANRIISTKISIENEGEYRASIQRINTELKAMQSALKLTESQYQTNANSMEALRAKHDALKNVQDVQRRKVEELRSALENAKKAQDEHTRSYEAANAKIEENNKKLEELRKTTGDTSKEEATLIAENERLAAQMSDSKAKIDAAEKGVNSWQTQLNNAQIQLNNLDAEISKNDQLMDEAARSADGCAKSIDEYGREVKEASDESKTLATILASDQLQEQMKKVADVLKGCVEAFSDYQTGLANVRATTGMSESEVDKLGKRFQELSTEIPVSTKEMLAIAAAAGQFGIKKDQIENFTVSMSKLGAASGVSADSVASLLAQFSNITGEKDFERLASAITRLNYNSATGATEIINMSQGMAAAGKAAGMTAKDILAISAAVTSLGMGSQEGSTAMQRLIIEMQKSVTTGEKLDEFAKISGMSAAEFKAAWGENAVEALAKFVSGLSDTERNGRTSLELLDSIGISSQKEIQALIGLSDAELSLEDALALVNDEWNKNSALTEAAAIKNETLAAKTQELDSAADNLKIAIGESLAPLLSDLTEKGTDALKIVTQFVQDHPQLTEAITLTAGGIAGITTAIAGIKAATKAADFLGLTKPLHAVKEAAELAGGGISGMVSVLGTIAVPAAVAATALAGIVAVADRIKTSKEIGFLGEGHTLEEYAQNVEVYRETIEKCKKEIDELALYGGDLTMAYDELSLAETALRNATEEYTAAQKAANAVQQESIEITEEQQASSEYVKAAQDGIKTNLQEIATSYREAYDACRESLNGQIGLFDAYAAQINEETDTAVELLSRWGEQTTNLQAYTENLKKAGELGLDQGLVQSLADGSTQSAGYLATIIAEIENCANGTGTLGSSAEEAVAAFNQAFENTQDAKDHLAATMTTINEDLEASLAELEKQAAEVNFDGFWDAVDLAFKDAGINFSEIGLNIGTGMKSGIDSSAEDVSKAAGNLADGATKETMEKLGENSPSKVFREIGKNIDIGLKQGIEAGANDVNAAVSQMGNTMIQSMTGSANQAAASFLTTMQGLSANVSAIMTDLGAAVQGAMSFLPGNMFYIGMSAIDGMVNGLYSESGVLYSAMYSIVNQAIQTARQAAGVHSPSRKTKEIFENVGEGMIIGIESKKRDVKEATAEVVNNALVIDSSVISDMVMAISRSVPDYSRLIGEGSKGTGSPSGAPVNVTNNNDIDLTINTLPGQDNREIANYVIDRMKFELDKIQGAYRRLP